MPSPSEPTHTAPRFVVVSPSYNNGGSLPGILEGLGPLSLPVIVVNDGSTDGTRETLDAWRAGDPSARFVLAHSVNRGKAAALHTGFGRARELGFTHALTIDTDGQHDPADLHAVIAHSIRHPRALVIGARPRRMPGCPWGSTIGRGLSNHFVWVASGVRVGDSQSGMRSYPLDLIGGLGTRAGRYAFETEVLTRAGWAGVPVLEVPITGIYKVAGGRTTHFRVGRDTGEAIGMHARLIARSLLPGDPVARLEGEPAGEGPTDPMIGTILHRAWWWLGPRRLGAMLKGDDRSRERLAASVGTGLFMATVPVYGIKTVACLWLAAKFRLHPTVVIAVSSLSTPPLGFVFAFVSLIVGYLLLHGALPTLESLPRWETFNLAEARLLLAEWIVGSVVVGTALGALGYGLARLLLRSSGSRAAGG